MAVGEFEFGTSQKETMTVVSGALTVRLPGGDDWTTFGQGEQFVVAADEISAPGRGWTAYLCIYG